MTEGNSMKIIITQEVENDAEGRKEVRRILNAGACYAALWDIGQEVFRPARKHGYPDTETAEALEKAGEAGPELVQLLEKKFYEILSSHDITTED